MHSDLLISTGMAGFQINPLGSLSYIEATLFLSLILLFSKLACLPALSCVNKSQTYACSFSHMYYLPCLLYYVSVSVALKIGCVRASLYVQTNSQQEASAPPATRPIFRLSIRQRCVSLRQLNKTIVPFKIRFGVELIRALLILDA